jgi:hypothetical protein
MPIMILLWWTALLAQWPVGTTAVLVALAIAGLAIAWDKERRGPRRERTWSDRGASEIAVDGADRSGDAHAHP